MKKIFITFIVLILYISSFSQDGGWRKNESEVKVYLSNISEFENLKTLHLSADIYNDYAIVYAIPNEIYKIKELGLQYEILKSNLNEYYSGYWNSDVPTGYYEYQDIIDIADSLATNFPNICQKIIFGTSMGGRQLTALKISDNAATDENEAEVLFDGGIHGDEIGASENVIRFARDLCLGYEDGDPQITALINTREIWLYLMVNPDGRANMSRRNNNGVDLNRDWGYMWDGWGNSTGEYSQIESKALRSCSFDNQFVIHTTYHSGIEYISLPWSYRSSQCPDFGHIYQLAGVYASESGYSNLEYGQGNTGMYAINGSTKDSNYGIQGSISWSMEISQEKQPPANEVIPYYNKNKPSMLAMIEYSGYGLEGTITDAVTGDPVQGIVFVNDYFQTYTDPIVGDYHKYVLAGNYSITVTANGYETQTIDNVVVTAGSSTVTDFQMQALDGQYAYKIWSCRIPDNNEDDEGNTMAVFGAPDNVNYSIGKSGTIVLDMQDLVFDGLGNDIKIFEGDASPETYNCYAGETADGPWELIGTGTGTTEFDFAGIISEAQFIRIEDDGDGSQNVDNAGFDLDAVEALEHVSGVYLSVTDYYIDDSATGNNNNILDPGETADLIITVRNNGDINANNIVGDIVSSDLNLILISTTDNFGTLAQSESSQGTFTIQAISETSVGHEAAINLNLSANSGAYTKSEEINITIGEIPIFIISDGGSVTTCAGLFYDSGGESGAYQSNENYTMTFYPGGVGSRVEANFTSFDIEPHSSCSYDALKIYDGTSSSATLIGTYCGTTSPGFITATNDDGALTFVFTSDGSVTNTGWIAEMSCFTPNTPSGTLTGGYSNICTGSSTGTMTLSNYTATITSWRKRVDAGSWTTITNTSNTYSEDISVVGLWEFQVVLDNGTYYSNSVQINVNADPVAGTASVDTDIICQGETVELTLSGYSGDIQWQESPDGSYWSDISGAVSTPYTTNALDADTYFRAEVSNSVCDPVYSNDEFVTVNDAPVAGTATAGENEICTGETVILSLTGYTGNIQWQNSPHGTSWTDISGANSDTYTSDALDAHTYFRAEVSTVYCGEDYTNAVAISIFEVPEAGFESDVSNQEISFTNISSNATSYSWDFGDGNTSTDENPVHTYTESGTYTVALTAVNGICSDDVYFEDIDVAYVGISHIESNVRIIPNPNNGLFKIDLGNLSTLKTTVSIYTISGQIIYKSNVNNSMLEIDISNYTKGVYFVKITSGNETFNSKIVKM